MRTNRPVEHDVFISYAHEDHEFVRKLRVWLERAGFDVWLDRERMRAGQPLQSEIYAALKRCRKALFVLSKHWLKSDWGPWELNTFHSEHKKRIKVPLLLSRLTEGEVPNVFTRDARIHWFEEKNGSEDALFWLLYCALLGENPGDPGGHARRGRAARRGAKEGGGSVLPARTEAEQAKRDANRARLGWARAALRCDRSAQWKAIEDYAELPRHEALFIQGAESEAPELFLQAVQKYYPDSPDRHVVPVAWQPDRFPQTKGQFLDELARALGCPSHSLLQKLRAVLRQQNLVLVHRPQLPAVLRSPSLVRYYTRHVPELISELGKTAGYLKLIQGIVCSPPPGAAGEVEPSLSEPWIRDLPEHPSLCIIPLPPLQAITPGDVERWTLTLPSGLDRSAIMAQVLEGAANSAEILSRIIDRFGGTREHEREL